MNTVKRLLIGLFMSVVLIPQLKAKVQLNALFSDHMVIQRDTNIPIWGWASPGEEIIVTTSWGASIKGLAKQDSTWMLYVQSPKAGGPHTITVKGENEIVLKDVLSGEVWLCGGQSNMDHHLGKYLKDAREPQYQPLVEFLREEVAQAHDTLLRTMVVPHQTSIHETKTNFKASWVSVSPGSTETFSATGYFFAKELREKLNVPVGLVECAKGGTRVQPWISEKIYMQNQGMKEYYLKEMEKAKVLMEKMAAEDYVDENYETAMKKWKLNGEKGRKPRRTPHPNNDIQFPGNFYRGMLASIIPYAIKGCIWYQGESNSGSGYLNKTYQEYFTTLIHSWRKEWKQGEFPFYWVQLSAFQQPTSTPKEFDGWASVNDQQRRSLSVANTGMAVTYDIGEAKDIHPHNKIDVGKRLSLWALSKNYGYDDIVYSGPLYKNHKIKKGKVVISFTNEGGGLMVGKKHLLDETTSVKEPLKHFQISDKEGNWYWASAAIAGKNKIKVWHTDISEPIAVRYAWARNPEGANLYNKEGLPASVFTTEEK
ncbi:sialate O-acetylesterase [Marinilabilia sp.]